jgi:phenylalanyl-tRNA synthetase beta chain
MQIPINWVNELVEIENSQLDSLVEKLTLGGFEVEEIIELKIGEQKQIALDISATANRSDSLSIQGLSTEIAALLNEPVKISKYALQPNRWKQVIEEKFSEAQIDSNCSIFLAILVENISKIAVPKWITQKLLSSGIVPSGGLSDFQSYVLLETGYPFSFYDFDKICLESEISDQQITISPAVDKQVFIATNSLRYELDSSILTVNVNGRAIGIAGLTEAASTECTESTRTLLIEASVFNAAKIRQQSRKLGLRTERSARYEKSLKNTHLVDSLYRLIMLLRIANPSLNCKLHTAYQMPAQPLKSVFLRYQTVNEILGPISKTSESSGDDIYICPDLITSYLNRLNFEFVHDTSALTWLVSIPRLRDEDITREIDLIEEVGRLHGFNNFLTTLPEIKTIGVEDLNYKTRKKITSCLLNFGFNETIHYSLVGESTFVDNEICLVNPLVSDYSSLRSTLLPSLIKTLQDNLKQKNIPMEVFEYSHVFGYDSIGKFKEEEHVAGVFGGIKTRLDWSSKLTEISWFEAKGKIEQLFKQLNICTTWRKLSANTTEAVLHTYRSAEVHLLNGPRLGVFGQIHPILSNQLNISSEIYLFEFDLEVIKNQLEENKIVTYQDYSTYPKTSKDVSFIISKQVSFAEIQESLYSNGTEFLINVDLIDEYQGTTIPPEQTSLCLQLTFQSNKRTLENKEIENIISQLQLILVDKFNATIRT